MLLLLWPPIFITKMCSCCYEYGTFSCMASSEGSCSATIVLCDEVLHTWSRKFQCQLHYLQASVSSLHGRGTAASDLLTSLVSPPQGGRSGPLHAGLLQDPSQLSSAFAGSFPINASNRFGSSGRQHQMPDWRLPSEFILMSSGGTGPAAPSLERPLSGGGPVPGGWGCFGAGSLSTAGAVALLHSCNCTVGCCHSNTADRSPHLGCATTQQILRNWVLAGPAADGRQPAPRRASMRVDLAASDTADMLPRMGCPVCTRITSNPQPSFLVTVIT